MAGKRSVDHCVEQVVKGRKATEPPGALLMIVSLELENGEKLRMLQRDVNSSALVGDIKWQQQTGPCVWVRHRAGEFHPTEPLMPLVDESRAGFALALMT